MSLLGERLKQIVPARYEGARVHNTATDPNLVVTFEAAHREVGGLAIMDDGDELTIYIGNITHSHFSCYDSDIQEVERANLIVDDLLCFLDDLFHDRVLLWVGRDRRNGGWRTLSTETLELEPNARNYVWSGPVSKPRTG
jgi:hypothetical protein